MSQADDHVDLDEDGGWLDLQPHRGTTILALGILGLILCCVPVGIVAWVMGSMDLTAMHAGLMDRSGEGMTRAGQILGIVGTVCCTPCICSGGFFFLALVDAAMNMRF